MKKILLLVICCMLLLVGCGMNTPKSKVEAYLNRYSSLSDDVKTDLETKVGAESLSIDNQKVYKEALTRQYQNMKYEIKDESIDGDKATVKVKLTVYDLYKVDRDSINYMNNNANEFYDDMNQFSEELFNKYRVNGMLTTNETVNYEVDFYLNKVNGEWILETPDRTTLEKIHGMYNYEM